MLYSRVQPATVSTEELRASSPGTFNSAELLKCAEDGFRNPELVEMEPITSMYHYLERLGGLRKEIAVSKGSAADWGLAVRYNGLVEQYEAVIGPEVKKIRQALVSGDQLLPILSAHFRTTFAHTHAMDAADILLAAGLRIDYGALRDGTGRGYSPTPCRHFYPALEAMQIEADDHIVDLGCGPGITLVKIANAANASTKIKATGLDSVGKLVSRANRAISEVGLASRAAAVQCDFLTDPLPLGTKFFAFEPVERRGAELLVERLAALETTKPIEVYCYAPRGLDEKPVMEEFRKSEHFTFKGCVESSDIYVFRKNAST